MYTFERRAGAILLLFCAAVMAGVSCWYPWYLCSTCRGMPDDGYRLAAAITVPFWFIAPAISGWAAVRLFKATVQEKRTMANTAFAVCGGMLALVGFSPLFLLVY
jgi:hypothetical protein